MPVRQTIECDICGYSYDKDNHEYCPKCEGDVDYQSDDKQVLTPNQEDNINQKFRH